MIDKSTKLFDYYKTDYVDVSPSIMLAWYELGILPHTLKDFDSYYEDGKLSSSKLMSLPVFNGCNLRKEAQRRIAMIDSLKSIDEDAPEAKYLSAYELTKNYIGKDSITNLYVNDQGVIVEDDDSRYDPHSFTFLKQVKVRRPCLAEKTFNSRAARKRSFSALLKAFNLAPTSANVLTKDLACSLLEGLATRVVYGSSGFSGRKYYVLSLGEMALGNAKASSISMMKSSLKNGSRWSSNEFGDNTISKRTLLRIYASSIGKYSFKEFAELNSAKLVLNIYDYAIDPCLLALAIFYAYKKNWLISFSREAIDQIDISEFDISDKFHDYHPTDSTGQSFVSASEDFFAFKGRPEQEMIAAGVGLNSFTDFTTISSGSGMSYRGLAICGLKTIMDVRIASILSQFGLCCFDTTGYSLYEVINFNNVDVYSGSGKVNVPRAIWFNADRNSVPAFETPKNIYCENFKDNNEIFEGLTAYMTEFVFGIKNPDKYRALTRKKGE